MAAKPTEAYLREETLLAQALEAAQTFQAALETLKALEGLQQPWAVQVLARAEELEVPYRLRVLRRAALQVAVGQHPSQADAADPSEIRRRPGDTSPI